MNPDIAQLQNQVAELQAQILELTRQLSIRAGEADFEELIRNIVLHDSDSQHLSGTSSSTFVTGVDFVHSTVTTGTASGLSTPTIMLRVYFRGKPYNIPAYALS